jgi:hypothetical protein
MTTTAIFFSIEDQTLKNDVIRKKEKIGARYLLKGSIGWP